MKTILTHTRFWQPTPTPQGVGEGRHMCIGEKYKVTGSTLFGGGETI